MGDRLAGRVAVVTGGGHGLGRAYCERFAAEGAAVVVAELDERAGEETRAALRAAGARALAVPTDVADAASLARMVERAEATFGGVDVLVNNAAVFASVPVSRSAFDEIDPAEWDAVMRVNLAGTWLACRAVAPLMRRRGYGKIVNVSSDTAFKPVRGMAHYVASKAGVVGLTRVLAHELGPDGVRVNCVAPGSTLSEDEPDEELLAAKRQRALGQALPGVLSVQDITGAVLFLASRESDAVTGQTVLVNAGAALH
ncbi:SDR family NAD(P)-dependent oxidoreductase [Streptomyces sp. 4N509B]|uniref:SDR family NAD(P)-dependent oxidoreductase n=1 Tax=Streptomyces sp. 4N509B TaxID=3457413 RepID=UPI003FD1FF95